jgi:hypothetical protein
MRLAPFLKQLAQLIAPCAPKRIVQCEHDPIVNAVAVIGDSSQHHWCEFVRPALGALQEGPEILAGRSEERTDTAAAVIEALEDGSMKIEQLPEQLGGELGIAAADGLDDGQLQRSSSEASSRAFSEETKASERASCAKRLRI